MSETVQIASLKDDGTIPAYVARPAGTAKGAVIVIPEIFGVNPGIRQKADKWAEQGYLAVAPDIFWRFAPGVELNPDVEAELNEAFGYFQRYDPADGVYDIESTIRWIRAEGVAKVGCAGYCLGGRIAYMAAARTDIDAAVGYYGVMIDTMLDEAHHIANPLLLHIAGADQFVSPEAQAAMHAGLDDHPRVTLYDYPGMPHGFAAEMGDRRHDAEAELADSRTEAFLAEHLA
ncbi:MAG TPA: dienelactone hydrolase family protein [Novosphingobium sp.]|nr:dienelactone hydrolase family protein [Novosphingobium sp.]HQA16785.1 dienelactone hydrolase family protein [Novosphingobium sp.]